MSRRLGILAASLMAFGLWGPMQSVRAQDSSSETIRSDAGESGDSEKTIFKRGADGQWRRVPFTPDAFDSSPEVAGETTASQPAIPDYFLSQLTLNGEVTDAGVMVTADVTIKVIAPDRWLKVPLRFDQAQLRGEKHEHAGDGEAVPVLDGKPNEGMSWLLRGKGEHRLHLQLRLPVRKTLEGEQLQLQLPDLGIITGKLELKIPSSSVTFREGEGVRLLSTREEDDATIAVAELIGERLDFRWNVALQPAETIIQEPTEIVLRLMDDIVELTAHQEIQFRTGQRKALRVRFPSTDFELSPQGVRVSDPNGTELWVQPSPPDEQSWVTVPIDGVMGNIVELDWQFTGPPPESEYEVVIDGFEVAGTRTHSGQVTVESSASYRVSHLENGDTGIKRIDVNNRAATSAYSFSGGQYRLKLLVEPVAPSLSVTPYYFLLVSQDRVELEAAFQINVDGGSFQSVPIRLHEKKGTSWVVEASTLTAGELRGITDDEEGEDDSARRWTLDLPDVVDRQTIVGLWAAYFFGLYGSQDSATFSLPTVTGARMFPGWLIVATADNVEVTTRARSGTSINRQDSAAFSARSITLPEWMKTQPQTVYRLTTKDPQADPGLETDVTVRTQQTTTSSLVELSMLDREVHISQKIAYNVRYGRVSRVRLQIPPRLAELVPEGVRQQSLEFSLNGEMPLEAEWSGRNVSLDLPSPRLGEFEIVVSEYRDERTPTSGEESLSVPIIRSLDQRYETVRLSVPDPKGMAVTVADEPWTKLATVIDGLQWVTDQPVDGVSLVVDRSLRQSPLRLTMSAALLQTGTDEVGNTSVTATYLVNGPVGRLVVRLPEDAENPSFEWNDIVLSDTSAVEEPEFPHQYRLALPTDVLGNGATPSRLTITYVCPPAEERWSQSHTIDFPIFPGGVWIEQTWWELTLPRSQHLFVSPGTMTPQFHWQRDFIVWSRKSNDGFEKVKRDILQEPFTDVPATSDSGNVYAFMSYGSPEEVQYRSLSKSLIVFLGAGLTLTISFLVVKVPVARHPSIWMFVGLALTGASLWYLEPMLLLLQPAAWGLILPFCAALLEYATDGGRRSRRPHPSDWARWQTDEDQESGYASSGSADAQRATTHIRSGAGSDSGIK